MPGYKALQGSTEAYRWANIEPGEEVEVEFDLPRGCRQLDIKVKVKADHITVIIMGLTVVDDDLLNRCDPEESRWEVRGTRLVVVLQKANRSKTPWPVVFLKDCKTDFDFEDMQHFF
ncbi:unnamed protein product [Polarella glacialis]|uniref:CS domain-containing protein n=1 Tax=Polarella glacialis TaxID=89957 RepID=A0A813E7A8_POLGL|nr:unnamed protein product [Polarella glacialis]CAE8680056.1 unnamed protein product [Polarella glacialis]